ncbi:hypothetical protein DFP72DRAFT_206013 [Ephemerocybe angulata]|uniref:Uncharacterized protein n=1 Tax=Ephemerocybe angulata TaxID=980116 RepID=A0A8H6IHC9_9AGAR|nr:hypothetical protein DFP72DRAFT_206013 [Tulosesus angulatus]
MSTTRYFQPLFLEDRSGSLTGSDFVDVHDRMKLSYRCTRRDTLGSRFIILELSSPRDDAFTRAVVMLDFGGKGELGTVSFGAGCVKMEKYLVNVGGGSAYRRTFLGQNGKTYTWSYRTHEDHEWTCVDASRNVVSFYNLKVPGEPPYANSSGCMLTVEEAYADMACEFLATCMIMRHIVAHNIE